MSHTMSIQLEIRDKEALLSACQRLELRMEEGTFDLYQTKGEKGIGVFLSGWRYPIIVKDDGVVACDNYGGQWGSIDELHKLTAYYGLEKAKLEARKQGYSITESLNEQTQEIELRVRVGG